MFMKIAVVAPATSLSACGGGSQANTPRGGLDEAVAAQDRAAQSSFRNAVAAAKVCFTDASTYNGCDPDVLGQIEPSLTFQDGPSTVPGQISTSTYGTTAAGDSWAAAAMSGSGTCWLLRAEPGDLGYGQTGGGSCTGSAAQGASSPSW